jgi:hypothetical protein
MYQGSIERTIGNGNSASAQITTGNTETIVYLRENATSADTVRFRLWKTTATSGAAGSANGYNLNTKITTSASTSQLIASASVTGASVTNLLAEDLVPGGAKSGGIVACNKVRTLQPETTYLLEMQNTGSQSTIAHITMVWSENEPTPYTTID